MSWTVFVRLALEGLFYLGVAVALIALILYPPSASREPEPVRHEAVIKK